MEDDTSCTDGDDFFENTANAEGYDTCSLKQGEFGGNHTERQAAWDDQQAQSFTDAVSGDKNSNSANDGGGSFRET